MFYIIASTFLVSLIAFIGVVTLALKENSLSRILLFLVSLSAGALMGGAFLHLIPEAVEGAMHGTEHAGDTVFIYVLFGFILFFLMEKVLHWRHCHKGKCEIHTFAYLNLFGEAVHNFIDGLIIAASFLTSASLGVVTTLAVALHEIPQEIGDFGVLVYGGFKRGKAVLLNFIVALTALLGGLVGFYLAGVMENATAFLLPFAAGGFIYIAASDLVPEIRKETRLWKALANFGIFLLGLLLMYGVKLIAHG